MSQYPIASYGGYSLFAQRVIGYTFDPTEVNRYIQNNRFVFIYNRNQTTVYIFNDSVIYKQYFGIDINAAFNIYIDTISIYTQVESTFLYDDGNLIYLCIALPSSPIQPFLEVYPDGTRIYPRQGPAIGELLTNQEMFADVPQPNPDSPYNDKWIPTKPLELINPHEHINVTYEFLKDSSNALSSTIDQTPVFNVVNCSLSNVTSSVKDVLLQVCNRKLDNVTDPSVIQKINDIKISIENNNSRIGRDDASEMYKFLYGKLNNLIEIKTSKDPTLTDNCLYSYFAGPSAVKAIMDSIILGEIVTKSIEYNLSPCFMPLAVSDKDVEEYINLGKTPGTKEKNTIDIYKFIDFWVSIEYCRVFQLITSDILGGVNAFYILRAIIDTTGFTGFISMPKGSGGSLGVDDKIAGYASFLYLVFLPIRVPICPVDKVKQYSALVEAFNEIISADTGFIRYATEKDNIQSIRRSVPMLMKDLNNSGIGSLPQGKYKSYSFNSTYNTYKIITLFYEFIIANPVFNDLTNLTNLSDDNMPKDGVVNPEWITWTCFQLSRYQQVRKFLVEDIKYEPSVNHNQYLYSLEFNRQLFCVNVKTKMKGDFTQALGDAINKIYKNEAFAGHDNNSGHLTEAGLKSKLIDEKYERFKVTSKTGDIVYKPNPQFIIGEVLREIKCTFFYKQYLGEHGNNSIWALGPSGPSIIEKREGIARNAPTNGLLEILTGPSDSNKQTTVATVIDFTKYYTETLLKLLSVEQINSNSNEHKQKKQKLEYDQIDNKDESMYSDNVLDELIQEQLIRNQIKPYNKITLFSTITGASDGSARTLTQNTVFITGEYNVVITLVDGITMEITFKSGDPTRFLPMLYINSSSPKDTDMDLIENSKGIVINHLGSYGFEKEIGEVMSKIITPDRGDNNVHLFLHKGFTFKFEWKDIQKSPRVGRNNYASFVKTLGASNTPDWLYKIFVESVLKNTELFSQHMKNIAARQSEGVNWRYIITLIAVKNPWVAIAFTNNLNLLGVNILNKNIQEAVAMCEKVIKDAQTQPKICVSTQLLKEYGLSETVTRGVVLMTVDGQRITLSHDNSLDLAQFGVDIGAIDTRDERYISLEKIENEIITTQRMIKNTEEIADIMKENNPDTMYKVQYKINLLRLEIKSLEEQRDNLLSVPHKGGGRGGGGIEEVNYINKNIEIIKGKIYKLESDRLKITKIYDEISNLKAKKEQIMVSMLKFTDVPISELELTKTAVFLGTDLFNKINLMVRENKLPYIEKIRFDVPLNVKDFVFPEGTSSKDFNDKIVFIQLIAGVYYVESAEDRITEILKARPAPIKKVIHRIEIKDPNKNMRLFTNQFKMVKVTAGGSKKRTLKRRNRVKKATKTKKNNLRKNKKMTKRVPAKPRKKTKRIH